MDIDIIYTRSVRFISIVGFREALWLVEYSVEFDWFEVCGQMNLFLLIIEIEILYKRISFVYALLAS